MVCRAPILRVRGIAEPGLVPSPAIDLKYATRRNRADDRDVARRRRSVREIRAVKTSADVGESEIAEQPGRNAITLKRSQRCVLRRKLRAVNEHEAADLQVSLLTGETIEL